MKRMRTIGCLVFVGLLGCNPGYEDSGAPEPATPWPWVCEDGGLAPDSGCPALPPCPDGAAEGALVDGC
jgi:hypothetical protein